MEAVIVDQYSSSISGYKQVRTPKKNTRFSGSRPSENIAPANMYGSGIFHFPPRHSLSFSYPPPSLASSVLHHNPYYQRQQNPPLLPLPVPMSSSPITRGLSLPPTTTRKINKSARDHSVTPRKPKSRPVNNNNNNSKLKKSESLVAASTNRLGPDPNDLPKALTTSKSVCSLLVEDLDKFSGSVFSLAPPPSSLPLPRFSMRPKLMSCNVEAAGIDTGATDDLRRLLRLR